MEAPILSTKADFILQPANAVTVKPRGWAEIIGRKFPHARVHRHRRALQGRDLAVEVDRPIPGTVVLCDSKTGPGVITVFNQLLPGEIGTEEHQDYSKMVEYFETQDERLKWFIQGLEQIGSHFQQTFRGRRVSIAVPPTADPVYQSVLQTFQDRYRQSVEVWLY